MIVLKRLEYHISFYEDVDNSFEELTIDELSVVTDEINRIALKYLTLAGFQTKDFKLEFDIKEGASVEEIQQKD